MSGLFRVVYCSRNGIAGDEATVAREIAAILDVSRRNNARDGITGGLLFSAGCFAQVLEGPSAPIEETFERIQCDPRHNDITVLEAGPIAERAFPDWSMGFTAADASTTPMVAGALANALAGHAGVASQVFDLLVSVVVRETRWATPGPTRPAMTESNWPLPVG